MGHVFLTYICCTHDETWLWAWERKSCLQGSQDDIDNTINGGALDETEQTQPDNKPTNTVEVLKKSTNVYRTYPQYIRIEGLSKQCRSRTRNLIGVFTICRLLAVLDTSIVSKMDLFKIRTSMVRRSGPSCSKLTTSLVHDSLKFTSSDRQIFWNFLLKKKMWVAFAVKKLLTFFQQKISEYCILNSLKQLTKWSLTSSLS